MYKLTREQDNKVIEGETINYYQFILKRKYLK